MTEKNPRIIDPEIESASSMAGNILKGFRVVAATGVVVGGVAVANSVIKKQQGEKATKKAQVDPTDIHAKYLERNEDL